MNNQCVVLFSGGTDSCCSAYLAAENFDAVTLFTFYEKATLSSPFPRKNKEKLQNHFPNRKINHLAIDVDFLVQHLSYENYFKLLPRYHFYLLSTPGFSSLSWHIFTILYCLENNIWFVFDGMTQELQHLPGHMPEIRAKIQNLYRDFGLDLKSPVYDWPVPKDKQWVEHFVVNRHHRLLDENTEDLTTGRFLYEKKFFDSKNVKGTELDFEMQHDCYPFILYNMMLFWVLKPFVKIEEMKKKIVSLFEYKIAVSKKIIEEALRNKEFKNNLIGKERLSNPYEI